MHAILLTDNSDTDYPNCYIIHEDIQELINKAKEIQTEVLDNIPKKYNVKYVTISISGCVLLSPDTEGASQSKLDFSTDTPFVEIEELPEHVEKGILEMRVWSDGAYLTDVENWVSLESGDIFNYLK